MPRLRPFAVAGAWSGAAVLASALLALGGPRLTHGLARFGLLVAPLLTAVACGLAAAHRRAAARWAWALLALAAAGWSISSAAAGTQASRAGALPPPWRSDVASALSLALAGAALLSLLGPALSRPARVRTVLDGLLVSGSLVFVAWALVWEDVRASAAGGTGELLVHPVGDAVLAALVLLALARMEAGSGRTWALLAAGLGLLAVGPTALAHLDRAGVEAPAGLDDVGWTVGCLLVGAAAGQARRPGASLAVRPRPAGAAAVVLPHVPPGLAAVVALARQEHGGLSTPLVANGALILVLWLIRALMAQLENAKLAHGLEDEVKKRTARLERDERRVRSLA